MRVSTFNNILNNTKILAFTAENNSSNFVERLANAKKALKEAVKNKADKDTFEKLYKEFTAIEKLSKDSIVEKDVPKIFVSAAKWLTKMKSEKTGIKAVDMASTATKLVLLGNFGKEVAGTILYTVQALTNEDLPPDKRKFVGMYDLAVGVVSTTLSFIFGIGLNDWVKNRYKNLLKPLTGSSNAAIRARGAAAIVGLAAFSSFALQTIVAKRIIAPAIATPVAGKLKKTLQDMEEAKKGKKSEETMSSMPPEALILAKTPVDSENKAA